LAQGAMASPLSDDSDVEETTQGSGYVELCFLPGVCKIQHPDKSKAGAIDADAVVLSSHFLGVCDGVSQVEQFGIRPDELPVELLKECVAAAEAQLEPTGNPNAYAGLIELLVDAYRNTDAHGSTTVLLTALDHTFGSPVLHVLNLGDCELVLLRRIDEEWKVLFRTEPQRVDGHRQQPLQLARVDVSIDPDFVEEEHAIPLIRKGSATAVLPVEVDDVVIIGSDGVFDNLFLHEIVSLVDLDYGQPSLDDLARVAKNIVKEAHSRVGGSKDTPMGRGQGGKADDTTLVVASIIPMHAEDAKAVWGNLPPFRHVRAQDANCMSCACTKAQDLEDFSDSESEPHDEAHMRKVNTSGACQPTCALQ